MTHALLVVLAAASLLSAPVRTQNRPARQAPDAATHVLEQCVTLMDAQNRLMDAFSPNTVPDQLPAHQWWIVARAALSTLAAVSRRCCPSVEAQFTRLADSMADTEPTDAAQHSEARVHVSAEFFNVVRQVTACVEKVAVEQERRLQR